VAAIRAGARSALPDTRLSVIHIPGLPLPRFIALPDPEGRHVFILLEDAIHLHLSTIYTGYDILSSHAIRITRDADLQPPGRPEDLLTSIEESLRERRLGTAVRLQYDGDLPSDILATLRDELEMRPEDL
jgi:polyphosphate kinase